MADHRELDLQIGRLKKAQELLSLAETPEQKRMAIHMWLGATILYLNKVGAPNSPGMELLDGLEALNGGTTVDFLKKPEGLRPGGHHVSPSERIIEGCAIAAIDVLGEGGEQKEMARQLVCDELGLSPASIKSLATKMRRQRALPENERTQYHDLIHVYEDERERLKKVCSGSAQQPEPDVFSLIINEVIKLAAHYGRN